MNVFKSAVSGHSIFGAIFISLFLMITSFNSSAQNRSNQNGCDLKVEYTVEQNQTNNSYTLFLKTENGLGNAEIKIVDFKNASKGIIDKKTINLQSFSQSFNPVFFDLTPSTYIVQIYVSDKCIVSVNGIEGIEIKGN